MTITYRELMTKLSTMTLDEMNEPVDMEWLTTTVDTPITSNSDTLREYFSPNEWKAIKDAVSAEALCAHEDDTEPFNSVARKINKLIDIPNQMGNYGQKDVEVYDTLNDPMGGN